MDINATIQQVLSNFNQAAGTAQPAAPPIAFNPSDYQPPNMDDLVKKAYDQLAPYYTKLLQESQGDVNRAITRLQDDYATGVRYTTQDVTNQTGYTKEDLDASLKQLGIQFPQEQNQLKDSLNQRGIALTDNPNTGKLVYAGGGEAGTEKGNLDTDQQLRQEAVNRNANRQIQQIGITGQRQLETLGKTQTRGIEDTTRQAQLYGEQLQQQRVGQAQSAAQMQLNQQQQSQQSSLYSQALQGQTGTGGGSGGGSPEYYTQLWKDTGHTGDRPVGWFG